MSRILPRLSCALLAAGLLVAPLPLLAAINAVTSTSSQQEERWTINLKNADIREFIDQVAEITGEVELRLGTRAAERAGENWLHISPCP